MTGQALGELTHALCRTERPADLDDWGEVADVDESGFVRIEPVTRWPGVTSLRWRPWTQQVPGTCLVELADPVALFALPEDFGPVEPVPISPGGPGPRLRAVAPYPELPTRAVVQLELDPSGRRVRALTIVTENMERYR